MKQNKNEKICISATAMVSSLGLDVDNSCAAARAGITRPSELNFTAGSVDDSAGQPVAGHTLPFIANGFEGQARLSQILSAALNDLSKNVTNTSCIKESIGLYLSVPDPQRKQKTLSLIQDEEQRNEISGSLTEFEMKPPEIHHIDQLVKSAVKNSNWEHGITVKEISHGHAGCALVLNKAIEDIHNGIVDCALVGGVDSMVTNYSLNILSETERLKVPDRSCGIHPGEGAALFLIEKESSKKQNSEIISAYIDSVNSCEEINSLTSGSLPSGSSVETLLENEIPKWSPSSLPWMIIDLNGEVYRATEWGNSLMRLKGKSELIDNGEFWIPAASFGDTGAASGAIGVCMAVKAFERGYALSETATVISHSDDTHRASISIKKAYNNGPLDVA